MDSLKKRIAIVGWGNIGKAAAEAVDLADDMEVAGVVRRKPEKIERDFQVVSDIKELGKIDVAVLALPSRMIAEAAEKYLEMGISTVDSFDIHPEILSLHQRLDVVAKRCGRQSVISAGWDPGSDSIVRALLEAAAPNGITHTNFGPGMSMGHTVAVRAIEGVKNALSMTIPKGEGLHRRMVYIEIQDGYDFKDIENRIKSDPYFTKDETHVILVGSVDKLLNVAHGVHMERNGVSGSAHNQRFAFSMSINNPSLTGQLIIGSARAALRQAPGCYTMIELPVVDFLPGERAFWIKELV